MDLQTSKAIVVGGSRGLGLGVVEALLSQGAKVTVVARSAKDLRSVQKRLGVDTLSADFTDRAKADKIMASLKPDILVIAAGAPPRMAPLDQQSWQSFSHTWEVDVKGALFWMQAALKALRPGARVLAISSGAAVAGSAMTGGYGGAKRMVWLMANYAHSLAAERDLDITFQTIIPRQQFAGTGIGDAASLAYSTKLGLSQEDYLKRFGGAITARAFGDLVVRVLAEPQFAGVRAFNIKGDTGLTPFEEGPN